MRKLYVFHSLLIASVDFPLICEKIKKGLKEDADNDLKILSIVSDQKLFPYADKICSFFHSGKDYRQNDYSGKKEMDLSEKILSAENDIVFVTMNFEKGVLMDFLRSFEVKLSTFLTLNLHKQVLFIDEESEYVQRISG